MFHLLFKKRTERGAIILLAVTGATCLIAIFGTSRRSRKNRIERFCRRMPKVDLHAHLSGSIRQETLIDLIQRSNKCSREIAGLCHEICLNKEARTLSDCFKIFDLIHHAVRNVDDLKRITREVVLDFRNNNVRYLELRTTPRCLNDGTTERDYVEAVLAVLNENMFQNGITVNLILSIDRSQNCAHITNVIALAQDFFSNHDYYKKTTDRSNVGGRIVGIDVGGNPTKGCMRSILDALAITRSAHIPVTIHCAEINDSDEAEAIICFKPERLGHALMLTHSQIRKLLEMDEPISIELCPTSNMKTLHLGTLKDHPTAGIWLRAGYPFSINTDDSGVFATDASAEYFAFADTFDLSISQISDIAVASLHQSFIQEDAKNIILRSMKKSIGRLTWLDQVSFGMY